MAESIEVAGLHHGGIPIPTAARVGPLVASGGILGMDPTDGTIPDDLEQQIELAFANVSAVMDAAGGTVEDIVKFTCFVPDRGSRDLINASWLSMFPDEHRRPARHMLTHELPGGVLIQIEILAWVQPSR
jgi:enamine deaminase RidA (YjgF/YER057c/UK114 family)